MTRIDPSLDMLVIGRDADGSWTIREGAGALLGRFASAEIARRQAMRVGRGTPVSIADSAGAGTGVGPRIAGRLTLRPAAVTAGDDA